MPGVEYNILSLDLGAILRAIYDLIVGNTGDATSIVVTLWQVYSVIAFLVSGLLVVGIIYAKIRSGQLAAIDEENIRREEEAYARQHSEGSKNTRWQDALRHIESDNPNDWRLAIIEADIMLEELLDSLGYPGLTIGDKLKQASPETFKTIDDAWKAHKIRNDIAHRGTDFVLTKRMAREALERYQRVFEEFGSI